MIQGTHQQSSMSVVDTNTNALNNNTQEYQIQFDRDRAYHYTCLCTCCCLPLATACIILPCLPCVPYCTRKEINSVHCKVTDKRIEYQGGWLSHSAKSIPLDRVQDVSINQSYCEKMFGIKRLAVETAGASGPNAGPELNLLAPVDVEMVRDVILHRRDALVFGSGHTRADGMNMAGGAGLDDINKTKAKHQRPIETGDNYMLVTEIRELKDSVLRIEKHLETGIHRMNN